MECIRRLTVAVVRLLTRLFLKVKAEGLERIPAAGAAIIAINHINFVDAPLLYTLSKREIIGLGKAEIWSNPILRLLAESLKGIPVRRGELDINAVRLCLEVLRRGQALGLAPEGTRSHHGRLQPGRPGVVLLALHALDTPIVPVAIYGQEHLRDNLRRLRRTDVQVIVGQAFYLHPGDGCVTHEVRQQMTNEIMMQIAALLPVENRGAYADLASATECYLRFPPGAESNLKRVFPAGRLSSAAAQVGQEAAQPAASADQREFR